MQRGSPEKKIPAQAVSEKKKFVPAENSPPPLPHHFSNGPSLSGLPYLPGVPHPQVNRPLIPVLVSPRGRRSKGKGKGIRARDRARAGGGRRVPFLSPSRAQIPPSPFNACQAGYVLVN